MTTTHQRIRLKPIYVDREIHALVEKLADSEHRSLGGQVAVIATEYAKSRGINPDQSGANQPASGK